MWTLSQEFGKGSLGLWKRERWWLVWYMCGSVLTSASVGGDFRRTKKGFRRGIYVKKLRVDCANECEMIFWISFPRPLDFSFGLWSPLGPRRLLIHPGLLTRTPSWIMDMKHFGLAVPSPSAACCTPLMHNHPCASFLYFLCCLFLNIFFLFFYFILFLYIKIPSK